MDNRENENLDDLIGDSRYIPFLHRTRESNTSLTVKWIVNFLASVVQMVNIPFFFFLLLIAVEQVGQQLNSSFTIPYKIFFALGLLILLVLGEYLVQRTRKNMVSPSVNLIWFMNFKGPLNNHFYSAEKSQEYSASLGDFVKYQADEYISQGIKETEHKLIRMTEVVQQLSNLGSFPNETFESLKRVIDMIGDMMLNPASPRNSYYVVLDRILAEIASTKPIQPYIKQGSIMLLDDTRHLSIAGGFHLHNNSIQNRKIPYGEKFAGKVVAGGDVIWVDDVNNIEAQALYGFKSDQNRPYTGIMGYPMRETGLDSYQPVGVIVLHLSEDISKLLEEERKVVSKTLEVYSQAIITTIKLNKYYIQRMIQYGIVGLEEITTSLEGGDTNDDN
ncbi:GAF domain-containing protein (plasmid) [Paenibacillus urinalis]|uniref:GAF domain-containing protein n=1 Tax=Paenibacillus urinalis TaxID=521520 RepID=A0AAX3N6M9_9BACL|nr:MULTISPECIES: GAF domain-containing protein [Paenibacillus]MCM3130535.1 GAF domain-containing protein [Paenibacillus sp. MER 78]WDH85421.1 GAF domain-containing protein [Paenibacillus urinalis]WDH95141.1 GAF domain-containing protein [Paenibacillus urinalis]WDI05387.1 GAF domain-containing protein [Paenibacillus urinalis]